MKKERLFVVYYKDDGVHSGSIYSESELAESISTDGTENEEEIVEVKVIGTFRVKKTEEKLENLLIPVPDKSSKAK